MNRILKMYATPAATAGWLIVGVTGTLMFFHVGKPLITELHEWLGLASVVAVGLHLARNWRPFLGYFRRGNTMTAALVLGALVSAVFIAPEAMEPEGAARLDTRAMFALLEGATVAELAPLYDVEEGVLVQRLEAAGFQGASAASTPGEISSASGRSAAEVLGALGRRD